MTNMNFFILLGRTKYKEDVVLIIAEHCVSKIIASGLEDKVR